jgi:hypothetical protein
MLGKETVCVFALIVVCAACGATNHVAAPAKTRFSARVDNPWFPLRTGSVARYRGAKDGKPSIDIVRVTAKTRRIRGARCVAVDDRLYLAGRLEERTTDWYSQDDRGNVWYFGENTAELDRKGRVTSTEGSWLTGRDGAKAGIFMPAHPRVGQSARQEYLKGQADDHFQILDVATRVRVPFVTTSRALLTKEWTPLEPDVLDHKYYVRGIGTVLEQAVRGPKEVNRLVSFRR